MEQSEGGSLLSEEEEQLALVDRFSRATLSSGNISEIYERFAATLRELMEIDWAAIALIDKPKDRIHLSPLSTKISSQWDVGETMLLSATPVDWVAQNKRAVMEPDLAQESRFWSGVFFLKQGIRSVVCMPLFSKGEVFGSLIVGSSKLGAYKERELKLLKYAASQIALPVENAELANQNRELIEQQVVIEKLMRIITSGGGIEASYEAFAQELKGFIPFDHSSIALIQGGAVRILAQYPAEQKELRRIYQLKDTAVEWVIAHKSINIESDFAQERHFPADEVHLKNGLRSEIRVPLFSHGEVFATLHLSSTQPAIYKEREQEFLERLASHIALPVENLLLNAFRGEISDFITAIDHFSRTSLTSITTSNALLAEELHKAPESVEARLIQNVTESTWKLESRLPKLLNLIQLRNPSFSLQTEPFELKSMLKEVATRALRLAQSKGQLLVVEMPSSPLYVNGNGQRLGQVLVTLLSNAIYFTPEGGSITLRAEEKGTNIIIEVEDSGSGFSPGEQAQILQPYYLAEADRQLFPDLRLGLAEARGIVELHGGEMWLESQPGMGNTFALSLPLASISP